MHRYLVRIFVTLLLVVSFSASYASFCRCQPKDACWPKDKDWQGLAKQLKGKLVQSAPVLAACKADPKSKDCLATLKKVKNPFYLQSISAGTESQGWLNAWTAAVSPYAIEAENADDIVAGVNFARKHNLRLVIKGASHDYLGRSTAPNSLLIWTHHMRDMKYHKSFVPKGCSKIFKAVPALTVSAGNTWLEAYDMATNKHGRYVQGGGCTTVGAAGGFTQGGGFGSWSKRYGTGAGSMLQAKVVLADGKKVIANQCQNKELFWALRGGGGGTYGVVTQMTYRAHPLPKYFGVVKGQIKADKAQDYQALIRQTLEFMRDHLMSPNWGEQISFGNDNTVKLMLLSAGLNDKQMQSVWAPLESWVKKQPKKYTIDLKFKSLPARKFWNYKYQMGANSVLAPVKNPMHNAKKGQFWWQVTSGEVYTYWYTYQSWWLPLSLFEDKNLSHTTQLIYDASQLSTVHLHLNKGLAGASDEALKLSKQTSTNPAVYNAAALVIMGASNQDVYPGIKGREPNLSEARRRVKAINRAMNMFRKAAPNGGSYVNETDYFEKNWQQAFWGDNYKRLYDIKQQVDPNGLFYCHHCVGSELWNQHGMCKRKGK
ncbi:MAG: FAD-binding protein [Coxiellaceae bacterium]|nr:FAD-binding protein [Coxiellaceae bacterium]